MIEYAGVSEQGPVRPNNEDYLAHYDPGDSTVRGQKGQLFVLADGVGGQRAGEVASSEAAQKLIQSYYATSKKPLRALQQAFQQANLHIYDMGLANPDYRRMETTLSALTIIGNQAFVGHVGDTRIYRLRGTQIEQLTNDHSEVGELARMQLITVEEARHHPRRNVITRTVGKELFLKVDMRTEAVELGDAFVLCSDGLWEPVGEQDIVEIVRNASAAEACQQLLHLALERESCDNISVQVIKVLDWDSETPDAADDKPSLLRRTFRFLGNQS